MNDWRGRAERAEKFVRAIASKGIHADLNPTTDLRLTGDAMYSWFTGYLRRIDNSLRESARFVLDESESDGYIMVRRDDLREALTGSGTVHRQRAYNRLLYELQMN